MKRIQIIAVLLVLCFSLNAQSGLMVTTKGGSTELISGAEFTFGTATPTEGEKNLTLQCGDKNVALSAIEKMEVFPPAIENGTEESKFSPIETDGLQFVGVWEGPNHTHGTKTTPHPGIWTFHNDGTFSWVATDVSNHDMTGTWKYDPVAKIIATDSFRCPVLTVVSELEDMIVLKNETFNQMYTLKRTAAPEVTLETPHIIFFNPTGFVVRISFANYQFINQPEFKYGVAYSYSTDSENFQKVYAGSCGFYQAGNLGDDWTGMVNQYSGYKYFGGDIAIDGFAEGDKLILRPFAEYSDGTVIYGDDLRAKVITPPVDGLFLGEPLDKGYATFWFNKGFENGVVSDTSIMYHVFQKDVEEALKSAGEGWVLPTSAPRIFRYYDGPKSKYVNIYSPINMVNGTHSYSCGGYGGTGFFVNSGSAVKASFLDSSWSYGHYEYETVSPNAQEFLIPCKKVKITW